LLNSENGVGPTKCTVADYAWELGVHYSDAMAEWFIRNGLKSTIHLAPPPMDDDMVVKLLRDPHTVANNNDSGAHNQMFCGGGENIVLLTKYVRERGVIAIEEAVHAITGKLAKHFSLSDRGESAVGKRADITVFNLDEIQYQDIKKVFDVPDSHGKKTWRWTRDPSPVRLTLVNGTATFENGSLTGENPGEMVAPKASH
jgi:N-acyl-D-aspartate/D-glutamate deacylase